MAAITDYTTLAAAIDSWDERDDHDVDEIIGLAEAQFRRHLGPHFAKDARESLAFTSGSATLPTGYVRSLALTHSTYGGLDQSTIAQVRQRRVWDASGIPDIYAITGSTVEVAPEFTGNLTFDYEGTLTGLSGANTTNWLITNAPDVYLAMCLSYAKAFNEDYQAAATLRADALQGLDDLVEQSTVGAYGRATVALPGVTP